MMNMCQYAAVCRGVPTVLSINDSFSRFYRELLRARGLGCVESAYLWTQVRAHLRVEKELLPTMDCVHVVSTEEADYLAAEAGLSNVTVIPIAVDDAYFGIGVACGGRRLLSVGNLRRSGLYRALWCFLEREWRSLRRCFPGVTLTVLGGCWIDERMREQLSLYEGVSVHGWVESDLPFLESCDACLAFDQVRGGMKNRVAQALAAGRALVGTPEAVEGLEGRDGQHFLAAASSGAMRTAVCDLLSSRTLAMDIGAAARRLAGARYAQAVVGAQWARLYGARVACAASATTNGERIRA
jgi:glycosyltransferase involved in cell wall biosynthesis